MIKSEDEMEAGAKRDFPESILSDEGTTIIQTTTFSPVDSIKNIRRVYYINQTCSDRSFKIASLDYTTATTSMKSEVFPEEDLMTWVFLAI